MVEDNEGFGFDKEQIGNTQLIGVGVGQGFVLADQIVRGVTDAARPEVGQVGGGLGVADGQIPEHA